MNAYHTAIRNLIVEPVGILGFGIEGQSTFNLLKKVGIKDIVVYDMDPTKNDLEKSTSYIGDDYLTHLNDVKTLIRSAGIRPDLKELNEYAKGGGKILSQLEILFEIYPLDKIIGVTGTLGKGTTCTLLFEMLQRGGLECLLGGNIGTPMLDLLEDSQNLSKYLVLELSSFQLSTVKKSPGTAVVLKTTAEHLDWHTNLKEYWNHKANITLYQTEKDRVIYYSDDEGSTYIANFSKGQFRSFGKTGDLKIEDDKWTLAGESYPLNQHKIKGSFNLENIGAAALAAQFHGVSLDNIKTSAVEFKGLNHRLEYLGTTENFSFYNDSYATRPDATIGAITSFQGLKLGLILGGSEKNVDFSELSETILQSTYLTHIAFIGDTADRMMQSIRQIDIKQKINMLKFSKLFDAVDYLVTHLEKGVILLSPACASFGLFRNYQERGEEFKEIVFSYLYSNT